MPQKFASLFLSMLLFFSTTILHAQEQAALAPMGALGNFSEVEKQILFNALQENLSIHYSLVSQQRFETAQEQAFDELEAEECTEDQCFAKIQELLQVENLFIFSIAKDNTYTQLSLTRVDIDGQRTVRTALCKQCNLEELNAKTAGLVQSISGKPAVSKAFVSVSENKNGIKIYSADEEMWAFIKNSNDMKDFRSFVKNFPNSSLTKIARMKLSKLERKETEQKAEALRKLEATRKALAQQKVLAIDTTTNLM